MPKFREALRSGSTRAAIAFLISRSRRRRAHRPAMARQDLVSHRRRFDRLVSNKISAYAVSDAGPVRLISSSTSTTPERIAEATIAIALRRARQEISAGSGARIRVADGSTGGAGVACG
jgi:hypothetical protein